MFLETEMQQFIYMVGGAYYAVWWSLAVGLIIGKKIL